MVKGIKKFKTLEQGIDYALDHDIQKFQVGGVVYTVDDFNNPVKDITELPDSNTNPLRGFVPIPRYTKPLYPEFKFDSSNQSQTNMRDMFGNIRPTAGEGFNKSKSKDRLREKSKGGTIDKMQDPYIMYEYGGKIPKYPHSMEPNVEVEGDETVKTPEGSLFQFDGPSHAEGGIPVQLPEGSKVFSEYLKPDKETIKAILGRSLKGKPSYADLSKKFPTKGFEAVLNDPDKDKYAKTTAQLNLEKNNAMLETIFHAQELHKGAQSPTQGQIPMAQKGLKVKNPMITEIYPNAGMVDGGFDLSKYSNNFQSTNRPDNYYDPATQMYFYRRKDGSYQQSFKRGYNPEYFKTEPEQPADKATTWLESVNSIFTPKPSNSFDGNKGFGGGGAGEDYGEPVTPAKAPVKDPVFDLTLPEVTVTAPKKKIIKPTPTTPKPVSPTVPENFNPLPVTPNPVSSINPSNPMPQKVAVDPIVEEQKKTRRKLSLGIDSALAGTIMDIGLALSDRLDIQNPVYFDNQTYPLFNRYVEFDNKDAARQSALAIQQIQNSNVPTSVKNAQIQAITAEAQKAQSQTNFSNQQRYEAKLDNDTNKLQGYLDRNKIVRNQDLESFLQKKARVEDLKNQFKVNQKEQVVNSVKDYLDYADTINKKNQFSENYSYNPVTGKYIYKGAKADPLKKYEDQIAQYAQNQKNNVSLPGGASFVPMGSGKGFLIDKDGKASFVDLAKK